MMFSAQLIEAVSYWSVGELIGVAVMGIFMHHYMRNDPYRKKIELTMGIKNKLANPMTLLCHYKHPSLSFRVSQAGQIVCKNDTII